MEEGLQGWRHIWLYAKRWYKQGDTMEDLRILIGHHSAIPPKYVEDRDILIVLCEVTHQYLIGEYRIQEFFKNLVRISQNQGCPLDIAGVAEALLSLLRQVRTRSDDKVLINLGEPDYNLLPASAK